MRLNRATMCLPTVDRLVSHDFYTAVGFVAIGAPGDDGLPEPLQFEVSDGLRVMLIPVGGFGWVIGDRDRCPQGAHECMVVIGLDTEAEVDDLMRRAGEAGAEIVYEAGNQSWGPGSDIDAYAGAFTDPDGHLWHVSRSDGVLIQ